MLAETSAESKNKIKHTFEIVHVQGRLQLCHLKNYKNIKIFEWYSICAFKTKVEIHSKNQHNQCASIYLT